MKYSLLEGFEKYDMLLAIAAIGDNKLIFVLDSGSTNNHIASFVHKELKDLFTPVEQKTRVTGLEGKPKVYNNVTADVELGGFSSNTLFTVTDMDDVVKNIMDECHIQIHGILGVPFLRDNNCTIDFGKMEIDIAGPKQMQEAV